MVAEVKNSRLGIIYYYEFTELRNMQLIHTDECISLYDVLNF